MSLEVMTEVWNHAPQTLKSDEMLLLVKLADWADEDNREAFPRVETLATKTHCTVRKTQMLLRRLVELDCIAIYDRPGHASLYIVQDLVKPHAWRDRYRWNGAWFILRKYKPSMAKPRGSLSKKTAPVINFPTEETKIPTDTPKVSKVARAAGKGRKQTTFFPALTPKAQ